MKKILFIHPFFPYPLVSGGHQALFNGILAVKDDYDIYLAYEAWEGEEYNKAEKDFLERIPNVHLLPLVHKSKKPTLKERVAGKCRRIIKQVFLIKDNLPIHNENERLGKAWISTITPQNEKTTEHIQTLFKKYSFDIVQVEMPWLVSHVLSLPKNVKKVYVHHELGFVKRNLEMNERQESSYLNACKKFADINEIALLNQYDAVITLSDVDKEKLIRHGVNVPVETSLAVIDQTDETTIITIAKKRLTFVGLENHTPNLVGITWFLDYCWKKLLNIQPDYQLDIIGYWSMEKRKEYEEKYPHVRFLGYVNDLGEALQGSVMIVPITIGSGIRMKILEACSHGIPFVSTSVGAEGIHVISGEHCFIADQPDEFVSSILKLQDTSLQSRFARNAKAFIENNYSISALKANRLQIYENLLTQNVNN